MTALARDTGRPAGRSIVRQLRWLLRKVPLHVTVGIVIAIWLIPTLGLIVNSFRTLPDMRSAGWWTALFPPAGFTLESYRTIIETPGFGESFLNSLLITIPATVLQVVISLFAGYAFAWMKFPGRDLFFIVIVGLMVVPVQLTFIPILKLFAATGLAGTFVAIWLAHAGYGLPFQTYLLRSYIGSLPREVFESADIDGANHVTKFWRIVVPMSVPAIAANLIFVFLGVWNDLLIALQFLGQSANKPVTVLLAQQTTSLGGGWQVLTAGAVLQMALPLLVFIGLQRYFVRGISAGAVKG
jgi:alpha-glucoside transport system permease protein